MTPGQGRHVLDRRSRPGQMSVPFVYEPTVLDGVGPEMACRDEETFGPVLSVYRVGGDEEALALINDTEYGLHASIVESRRARRARAWPRRIRTGTVSINEGYAAAWGSTVAPMGGMKASGLGTPARCRGTPNSPRCRTSRASDCTGSRPVGSMTDGQFAAALTTALRAMKAVRLP
jgi:succinate-semialdehyde dehydrogenase/glutarate-semialdehyde dehydrogenase